MAPGYCPKCGSKLYEDDWKYLQGAGVCSGCVGFDSTPDHRYRIAYQEYQKRQAEAAKKGSRRRNAR